jgi:hypothetical protein
LTLHTTGDRPIQDKLFGRGMIPVLNETAMWSGEFSDLNIFCHGNPNLQGGFGEKIRAMLGSFFWLTLPLRSLTQKDPAVWLDGARPPSKYVSKNPPGYSAIEWYSHNLWCTGWFVVTHNAKS